MILTHKELLDLVKKGVITALPENVGASSIDVRLGKHFMLENKQPGWDINLDLGNIVHPMIAATCAREGEVTLGPGAFCLASTMEQFNMPDDLSGEFRLRSTMARSGLDHSLAAWIDPGFYGSPLTLELRNNLQRHNMILRAGISIGQVVFHRHTPVTRKASYRARGRYNNTTGVGEAK